MLWPYSPKDNPVIKNNMYLTQRRSGSVKTGTEVENRGFPMY